MSSGRRDDRIEDDVNEALTQNGPLDATDIQVKIQQGGYGQVGQARQSQGQSQTAKAGASRS